jgi:hypothetical protein
MFPSLLYVAAVIIINRPSLLSEDYGEEQSAVAGHHEAPS